MPRKPLESLGSSVRTRRGQRKLREVAQEIGIGTATLMRIESGRIPDVETFGKLCTWLSIDPAVFLGFTSGGSGAAPSGTAMTGLLSVSAHFRAEQTPKPETIQALAQMLLLAARTQQRPSIEPTDGP